jgi:hypothetical protein
MNAPNSPGLATNIAASAVDDDRERGRFRVDRRVFVDNDVLALEQARIFSKCWLYFAHASEVAKPSSLLSREVAGHALFLTREIFPGHGIYDLRIESPGSVKIRRKRAIIDTDSLRSQGRVSIIL